MKAKINLPNSTIKDGPDGLVSSGSLFSTLFSPVSLSIKFVFSYCFLSLRVKQFLNFKKKIRSINLTYQERNGLLQ